MTPLVVLLLAVACSGAAGLTYQVLWLRQLSLVFGVTAYAASTVLAGFMAGLALGSLLAGRMVMRARRPLRWFAGAEVAIALTALTSLPVLVRLPSWYAAWHGAIGDDFGAVTLTRFLVALAVLVVPTSIMGATLPLLAASAMVRADHAPARVSAVYAANTAGAIVGALATGMSLIGAIGVSASFLVAAGLNLAAAVVAFGLTLRADPPIGVAPPAPGVDAPPEPSRPAAVHRAVLLVLGISGLASLALEVIWFRILVLFIPATTYAFTTMLAAVLLGIAGGGWIAAVLLAREREWLITLLRVQAATAVTIPLSLVLLASTLRPWLDDERPDSGCGSRHSSGCPPHGHGLPARRASVRRMRIAFRRPQRRAARGGARVCGQRHGRHRGSAAGRFCPVARVGEPAEPARVRRLVSRVRGDAGAGCRVSPCGGHRSERRCALHRGGDAGTRPLPRDPGASAWSVGSHRLARGRRADHGQRASATAAAIRALSRRAASGER